MATLNSASENKSPPKPKSHISEYDKVAPESFTLKQVDRFGTLYGRAYFIDHFLDDYRVKGLLPGKQNKDAADLILGKWNTEFGLYKGFNKYKNLETLKSNTSKAKLRIREMLGLVQRPAKGAAKGAAQGVAKAPGKRAAKHAAKKITVTAKKSFVATFKGASIDGDGKVSGRS